SVRGYRWIRPDTSAALTWGPLVATQRHGRGVDTLMVEATVQPFQVGRLTVPGMAFEQRIDAPGEIHHLPVVVLDVVPLIAATDTSADLRPVHGPLAAPWWEVVPWGWAIAI